MRPAVEIADVIRQFGKQYCEQQKPTAEQLRVLHDLLHCRTATLGGHEERCDCCHTVRYSYNSCGNRHCPKCLASKQALWIEKLISKTLPVRHYHLVFTVPHVLNRLCLYDRKLYYSALFAACWSTLKNFGYTHFGAETGAVCVLHSWGQNLSLHPHLHCLVPAAGYDLKGCWKKLGDHQKFLYPVHQLSGVFKGKFLDLLKRRLRKKQLLSDFEETIENAYGKKWVVYCEPAMANAEHVIRYLGQYTHRVAISNQRILKITKTHVSFIAKNYRTGGQKSAITITGVEFLRRFCQHILPRNFVKIRYYGLYNATTKRNLKLQFQPEQHPVEKKIQQSNETATAVIHRIAGKDFKKCPHCEHGKMIIVRELPRIRSPAIAISTLFYKALQ
ncbi:IS91 family transposase [Persicobacter diffluens]|uniref:Transposase y4qJ n=1 Tax=Persicobacter diffluens TaxID=981 RepID=A0AAN4W183_9BACT|nr:putative transposase y4qJ [Persicobacter diffluens]